jgi:DNA repair protein RadC
MFLHNHPSGDPEPSKDDINITKRLVETGHIIGINVLDHLVIAEKRYASLLEGGYINQ